MKKCTYEKKTSSLAHMRCFSYCRQSFGKVNLVLRNKSNKLRTTASLYFDSNPAVKTT